MSLTAARMVRRVLGATGVIAYPVLAHYTAATAAADTYPALGLAVALTPIMALLTWLAWRSPRRLGMLALCAGVGLLLWWCRDALERNFSWVYLIQHVGINALLAAAFGLTLMGGRQPLCARFAQAARGTLTPEVASYARGVTLAWTLFFVGVGVVSILLFLFGSIAAWSVFANFLSLPMILLMFVAEYLVRLRTLPPLAQDRISDNIRAFRNASGVFSGVFRSALRGAPVHTHPAALPPDPCRHCR